jgi:hypothetical protein
VDFAWVANGKGKNGERRGIRTSGGPRVRSALEENRNLKAARQELKSVR